MSAPPLLISCGILEQEILLLRDLNSWDIETCFLPSTLHFNFDELESALSSTLSSHPGRQIIVLYGHCHPAIDRIVQHAGAIRIPCQNCVEMLLGREVFSRELEQGAYFLLEEWARHWDETLERTFGSGQVAREIFRSDRRYLLALHTPCSSDFRRLAEDAAASVGLPVRHRTITLEHLVSLVKKALIPGYTQ